MVNVSLYLMENVSFYLEYQYTKNTHKILIGKSEARIKLGRPTRTRKVSINTAPENSLRISTEFMLLILLWHDTGPS
jgi:archaeosine-15-forming tRNA-guanine transglycosylase